MSTRLLALHVAIATVLVAGAAGATSRGTSDQDRRIDLVASAQPSDQRRSDHDAVFSEAMAHGATLKADTIATTTTECNGCHGESTALQLVYVPGPARARFDNVASAWTQDCWDCTATALSVQVVVVGSRTRARPTNRALAAGEACASCLTATAAFQLVVQVDDVRRLPDEVLAEIRAWFDAEAAALRGPAVTPSLRRAERAASGSLVRLRRTVVAGLHGRTLSARMAVTR